MAFIEDPDEEEQKQKALLAPELAGSSGAPVDVGGGSASKPSPEVSGTGGFTDVNAYLEANKDQASEMGNRVSSSVETEGAGLRGGIESDRSKFQTDLAAGTVRPNQGVINSVLANPYEYARDASRVADFQKLKNAKFTGPSALYDPDKELEKISSVRGFKSKLDTLGGPQGYKDYLYSSGKNPTLGQVELDSLLLGQDPTARGKIDTARQKYSDIQDFLDRAITESSTEADTALADTTKAKESAKQVFGKRDTLKGTLDTQFGQANKNYADRMATLSPYQRILEESNKWKSTPVANRPSLPQSGVGTEYGNLVNTRSVPFDELNRHFTTGGFLSLPSYSIDRPTVSNIAGRQQALEMEALNRLLEEIDPTFDPRQAQSYIRPYLTPTGSPTGRLAQDRTPFAWWDTQSLPLPR